MMNRSRLIFVVLLLGGLSLLTGASEEESGPEDSSKVKKIELSRTKQKNVVGKIIRLAGESVHSMSDNKTKPEAPSKNLDIRQTALGVAKILYYKEGQICSGIHLKPWIILTTAECVQKRDVDKLTVQITHVDSEKKKYFRTNVEVDEVTTHPDADIDGSLKNLALLYIYARYEWNVDEFHLPHCDMTTEKIIQKKIKIYTDHWFYNDDEDKYYSVKSERELTTDYGLCGEISKSNKWFCAKKKSGEETLSKVDVTTPLFYMKGKLKRLFAVFSGRNHKKTLKGHLYQSIYPSIDWIEEYLHEHSLPPLH